MLECDTTISLNRHTVLAKTSFHLTNSEPKYFVNMKLVSTFALLALLVGESNGFTSPKTTLRSSSAMRMSLEKYADELTRWHL